MATTTGLADTLCASLGISGPGSSGNLNGRGFHLVVGLGNHFHCGATVGYSAHLVLRTALVCRLCIIVNS